MRWWQMFAPEDFSVLKHMVPQNYSSADQDAGPLTPFGIRYESPTAPQPSLYIGRIMFDGIRSLLGKPPRRSETDEKLDQALENAEALDHYFFFSDQADADAAAERLQQRGWTLESVSLDANLQKWLLHARQPGPIEHLQQLQTELDLFADELHGEYDGWQVPGITEDL
ncbi:MAG: ribonuclease E inhibitor RraB [Candidatus Angelobacter sp.]